MKRIPTVHPETLRKALIRDGHERLILVHGCFHHGRFWKKDYDVLADGCRKAGFRGAIEGVFWDSCDFEDLFGSFARTLSGVIKRKMGLDAVPALLAVASRNWKAAFAEAVETGWGLGKTLAEEGGASSVVLLGHSLGCRVIKVCLETLAGAGVRVQEVHLLGAAIPAHESWSEALDGAVGLIWSYHSRKDPVLNLPYAAIELLGAAERLSRGSKKAAGSLAPLDGFSLRPVGLGGIDQDDPRLVNVDVSRWVTTHAGFEEHAFAFLKNIS